MKKRHWYEDKFGDLRKFKNNGKTTTSALHALLAQDTAMRWRHLQSSWPYRWYSQVHRQAGSKAPTQVGTCHSENTLSICPQTRQEKTQDPVPCSSGCQSGGVNSGHKRLYPLLPTQKETMNRLRQRLFLTSILQEANRFKRQEMLEHANADQINTVSEMVLNLSKKRIPVGPQMLRKLQRHKNVLHEVGKRRNSLKRRRQHLLAQTGSGFWRGLNECYEHVGSRR